VTVWDRFTRPGEVGLMLRERLDTMDTAKTAEIKSYGGGQQVQRLDTPHPFRVVGLRWDEEDPHEFTAVRKADALMAVRFMSLGEDEVAELLRLCTMLIGKTLDNTDGVPVQWHPEQLPKPADAGDDWEPKFRGPDGELHPMGEAEKFTDYAVGSSRRRWTALLVDNEFTVEIEVLVDITKDLIALSTGNPTDE
jgi:hypothetical protein